MSRHAIVCATALLVAFAERTGWAPRATVSCNTQVVSPLFLELIARVKSFRLARSQTRPALRRCGLFENSIWAPRARRVTRAEGGKACRQMAAAAHSDASVRSGALAQVHVFLRRAVRFYLRGNASAKKKSLHVFGSKAFSNQESIENDTLGAPCGQTP